MTTEQWSVALMLSLSHHLNLLPSQPFNLSTFHPLNLSPPQPFTLSTPNHHQPFTPLSPSHTLQRNHDWRSLWYGQEVKRGRVLKAASQLVVRTLAASSRELNVKDPGWSNSPSCTWHFQICLSETVERDTAWSGEESLTMQVWYRVVTRSQNQLGTDSENAIFALFWLNSPSN